MYDRLWLLGLLVLDDASKGRILTLYISLLTWLEPLKTSIRIEEVDLLKDSLDVSLYFIFIFLEETLSQLSHFHVQSY